MNTTTFQSSIADEEPMSESSDDKFRHRALDPEKREIRLCRFTHPAETPEKLTATLETFALHNLPPYTALSYEWGDSTDNVPVQLHGANLSIRRNLADFLTTLLRLDFHTTYFWIDQICIDQGSITERNHQVRLMSEIYSNAEEVIAWIGVALPHPKRRHLQSKEELKMIKASYWQRLWIAQELLLARKLRICGFSGIVDWEQVVFWYFGQQVPDDERLGNWLPTILRSSNLSTPGLVHFVFLRKGHVLGLPLDLLRAIAFFSRGECSNPRDKIYGLFGLIKPEERFEVDYSITPRALMYRALRNVLVVDTGPDSMIRAIFHLFAEKIGLRRTEWQRIGQFMAAHRSRDHRRTLPRNRVQKGRRDRRRNQ